MEVDMAALDGDVLIHKYELFNEMAVALAELQAGLRDRMTPKDILGMILEAETVDPVTHETAIDFLFGEGWLQEHDRILTESAVKHGRLIHEVDTGADMLKCSECSCRVVLYWYKPAVGTTGYEYCPHCGAKMDEEEQDEQAD